jgi:hypothetical protein
MWLICGGKPEAALEELGFQSAVGWPKGFYSLKERYGFGIIVLGELETTRESLLLRLFGKGKVLAQARRDFQALPPNAPEWRVAMAVETLFVGKKWTRQGWLEDMAQSDGAMDERDRRFRAQGQAQGLTQGLVKALVTTFETRFGPMPVRLRRQFERVRDEATLIDCQKRVISACSAEEFVKTASKRIGR